VFWGVNNQYFELYYTANHTVPTNSGTNEIGASQAWMFDSTDVAGHTPDDCRIMYQYFVN